MTIDELTALPALVKALEARVAELEARAATPAPDALVDVEEAAKLLAMTPTAVRSAAQRGSLPVVRVGRRLRFRPADLVSRARAAKPG